VCPTSYDLGEESKIVILSVTEGDDKPLKYPGAFAKSRLMVLNKIDLLPYVPFDMEAARRNARSIHPDIEIIETSCTAGNGLDSWRQWIAERMRLAAGSPSHA
jgi:hydrogenase nickel incorporation protein HypB